MLDGFYTAASGILTQERIYNVLSNNIANAKTPGYQSEQVVTTTYDFETTLRRVSGVYTKIGSSSPIQLVREVPTNYDSGLIEETGRPFDFAIDGPGFFNIAVAGEEGTDPTVYMSRNGAFDLDAEGYLVLPGVGRVQGVDGDIKIGTSDFFLDAGGGIYDLQGNQLGQLLITDPGSDQLQKYQNGLYQSADPAANIPVGTGTNLAQGCLESSNIDTQRIMTQVMESQRNLQACSQILKIIDDLNAKAVSQIAKL